MFLFHHSSVVLTTQTQSELQSTRRKSIVFIHSTNIWTHTVCTRQCWSDLDAQMSKILPFPDMCWKNNIVLCASGLSGKLTSRGVCVCISTAFEGNLLDSYFMDLIVQKPLRIHRHSVPVFIPLEELSAKYLETNIQHFLFTLCEYLNAYSGRKYQADRLQVSVWDLTEHFMNPG